MEGVGGKYRHVDQTPIAAFPARGADGFELHPAVERRRLQRPPEPAGWRRASAAVRDGGAVVVAARDDGLAGCVRCTESTQGGLAETSVDWRQAQY